MILEARNPPSLYPTFVAISIIHAYCVAVIAGSVASAEERQMGTLAGQILQPADMRVQWAVKVVVTLGIALLLAFGLPVLLMAIHRPADTFVVESDFMIGIGILCAAAIWVSSVSHNGLWALLGTVPIIALAGMIGAVGFQFLRIRVGAWMPIERSDPVRTRLLMRSFFAPHEVQAWLSPFWQASTDMQHSLRIVQTSLIVGFGVLVLSLAARNHRRLDRSILRVISQMLILALFAAAATAGFLALSALSYSWMRL